MVSTRLLPLPLALALVLVAAVAPAQEREDRLPKLQAYLERDPYHDTVFTQLVHEAVEAGSLGDLERAYAERLVRDGGDVPARVVLARLHARAQRERDALALLDVIEEESAPLLYLRGTLHLALGEPEPAVAELDRAAAVCDDGILAARILTVAGRTWHRLRNPAEAERAFRSLGELEPESYTLRLEVAALMAESGLDGPARGELDRALELADGDPSREVRAWVAIGRLEERRGRAGEAEVAYARAAALTGPGHWQRGELFERRLAIHRAHGTLDELIEDCRTAAADRPSDGDARRFLARALEAAGHDTEALDELERAVRDLPGSLELGREYAGLLADAGRADEAIVHYQDLAAGHPDELGLRREAGVLLATLDRLELARAQWDLELARAPGSVDLHLELARLHDQFGLPERAGELLQAACDVAPWDMRPVRALVLSWRDRGLSGRSAQLLEKTQRRAAERGDAHVLEELANDWLERDDTERAIRALELALAANGEERRILKGLAALLEGGRKFQRTADVLLRLFELAPTPRERAELSVRIGAHYRGSGRLRSLVRAGQRARHEDPDDARAAVLLAHGLGLRGEHEDATAILAELLENGEHREDALRHMALLDEARGDFAGAASDLRELAVMRPSDRRRLLEDVARLYRRAGDESAAKRAEDELFELSPNSRTLLTDLARKERKRSPGRAAALLERALELNPADDESRLGLAELELRLGHVGRARNELVRVLRSRESAHRAKARALLRSGLLPHLTAELELATVRGELDEAPERYELGIFAILLSVETFDYRGAQSILDRLTPRFPVEPAVVEIAGELRGLTLASLDAPYDRATGGDLALADLHLSQGDRTGARPFLAELGSPVEAANLYLAHDEPGEAQRVLERACREASDDPHLWMRLAIANLAGDREGRAARAVGEAVERSGGAWNLLFFEGELHLARGYNRGAREVGVRLFAGLRESRAIAASDPDGRRLHDRRVSALVAFYVENGLERDFLAAGETALLAHPHDPALLDAVLSRMTRFHRSSARRILDAARAVRVTLISKQGSEWAELLRHHTERFEGRRTSTRGAPGG